MIYLSSHHFISDKGLELLTIMSGALFFGPPPDWMDTIE